MVNKAADGQVIGVEELKLMIFWLQDALYSHLSILPPGCSIVKKSMLLYDSNLNHEGLSVFPR